MKTYFHYWGIHSFCFDLQSVKMLKAKPHFHCLLQQILHNNKKSPSALHRSLLYIGNKYIKAGTRGHVITIEGGRFQTKSVFVHITKLWNSFPDGMWMLKVYRDSERDWIHSLKRNLSLAGRPLSCRWLPLLLGCLLLSLVPATLAAAGGQWAPGWPLCVRRVFNMHAHPPLIPSFVQHAAHKKQFGAHNTLFYHSYQIQVLCCTQFTGTYLPLLAYIDCLPFATCFYSPSVIETQWSMTVTVIPLACWNVRDRVICARLKPEESSSALLIFAIGMEKLALTTFGGVWCISCSTKVKQ